MLSERGSYILRRIVEQYIDSAQPVASQALADEPSFRVSPATIRNEMALLEQEGYIMRPHTSAGCVPADKGYRFYVESLGNVMLPATEQRLISHLFHQAEKEVESWMSLTATLLAKTVRNVAVVGLPRPAGSTFKHVEVISLQESRALVVLVLEGAKVKQKLISFTEDTHQPSLAAASRHLSELYAGLGYQKISEKAAELSGLEKQIAEHVLEMMRDIDNQPSEETYLDGFHYMMNQPEFARNQSLQALIDLMETRMLLPSIRPANIQNRAVHVIIGSENESEAIKDYSVVISQYGLPSEAVGTIGVVGPTRMQYSHTIPTVAYLSTVLTHLMAGLYGARPGDKTEPG